MTTPENHHEAALSADERSIKAYEELKSFVAGETLGSTKYKALLDCAEFYRINGQLYLDRADKQPSDTTTVAAYGALRETIRTRMFEREAREYSSAFSEASDILNSFAAASVTSLIEKGIEDRGAPLNRGMHDAGNTVIACIRRDEGLPQHIFGF